MFSRAAREAVQRSRAVALSRCGFPRGTTAVPLAGRLGPAQWARGMAKDIKPPQTSRFSRPQGSPTGDRSTREPQLSSQPTHRSSPAQSDDASLPTHNSGARPRTSNESSANEIDGTTTPRPFDPEAPASGAQPQIPLPSLPDLTQGIPSTLEYETAGARSRSSLTAVDEEGQAAGAGGRGRGELPASSYITSTERRRQRIANWFFGSIFVLGFGGTVYMGRDWNEEDLRRHPDVPNGRGLSLWWNRARARLSELLTYYHEPAFEKLLPDPDPMFSRPYTLCISLEDMLVHSEWSREHGWRVAKRPGVDYFLRYLSQYYELVLFTTVPFAIGEPLVRKLDPFRFIVWPLYREATKYKDGEVVKDLSYLNRDLSKVIILDTNAQHVRAQPENAIILPKWNGDSMDKDLVALIPFLEYIFTMEYGDVRKVLKSFEGTHIPTEFARREAIARAEFNRRLAAERGSKVSPKSESGGVATLGSLFGLKPSKMSLMVAPEGEQNPQEALAQGKMLQDIARERGQRNYEMLEKEIRENGEKWLKEEAELQEKAQKEAMNSMKSSFTGFFLGPKPPEAPAEEKKP